MPLTPEEKKAKKAASQRKWRTKNKARASEIAAKACAKWQKKNPEYQRARYHQNKERLREVRNAAQRRFYHRHKEAIAEASHAQRNSNSAQTALNTCRGSAKRKNIPFNLEVSDIIIPEYCPVFGIKLARGRRGTADSSPSVDRIIPALGYTKGNIIVVSGFANRLKSNASIPQLARLAEFYSALRPITSPAA